MWGQKYEDLVTFRYICSRKNLRNPKELYYDGKKKGLTLSPGR